MKLSSVGAVKSWLVAKLGPPVGVSFLLGLVSRILLEDHCLAEQPLTSYSHLTSGLLWLLGMKTSTLSSGWMSRAASPEWLPYRLMQSHSARAPRRQIDVRNSWRLEKKCFQWHSSSHN